MGGVKKVATFRDVAKAFREKYSLSASIYVCMYVGMYVCVCLFVFVVNISKRRGRRDMTR